jgi:hypothetical protein
MTMQVTSKMARLGSRLAKVGMRHRDLENRIASVEGRSNPDRIILARLKREKARLQHEMNQYACMLRSLSRELPRMNPTPGKSVML